ncbi:MAG: hypothetical protein IPM56_00765 [Ignavibacteriales bacterium]|nr:MAG: hypothetical protein IPM56_00765 [Ignavibacteriales bacterium]
MSTDSNNIPLFVRNYLNKFSEKVYNVETNSKQTFHNIIVIPCVAESENIKIVLSSLSQNDSGYLNDTLILFVINNSKSDSDEVKNNNLQSINYLKDELHNVNVIRHLGFIDATTPGNEMDHKHAGVGLARKIGMDAALLHFNYSSPDKNILICLDADCKVSENYLKTIVDEFNSKNLSAASLNFEHPVETNINTSDAIICYELFLRYYVVGLKLANSPYAFETIGSSMACDVESYIKIGGMNKKKAAEDFYFLEKLSKVTSIHTIKKPLVYPSGRRSWRVPFGTGQRVGRFLDRIKDEYLLYDIRCFIVLKQWLESFSNTESSPSEFLQASKIISEELYNFLLNNDFKNSLSKIISNSKNIGQIEKQKRNWFDGFRTLKLIHHLRDTEFPLVNMFDALDQIFDYFNVSKPDRNNSVAIPDLALQKEYLFKLRELEMSIN